ncbi:MAG TPA: efflux RND transporter periplasmic adaptor subunit [Candidatus Anammoximicrobium sp.]|nr:efflux RND transporter periplasmic adaptor subunit [Candidatus Anammoximicrobium sp.]
MFVHWLRPFTAIAVAGVFVLLPGCQPAATEEAAEDPLPKEPVPVSAVQAELATLRPSVDLVGTLVALPECTTTVSPQVAGWVQKVLVVEGAAVQAGDELVLLDSRLAEVEVARATASVAEKEAVLAKLKRGYLPQELEMARQDVQKCKETMDSLRAEVAALEPLRQNQELSDVQYQKFTSSLHAAEASHAAAQAKLRLLEAGTPREEIAEAEARVAIAKAELAAATLNRDLCKIASPTAGTVTQLLARQGAFVEHLTPLLTIVDLSRLFMQVRVPNLRMAEIQPGARADVRIISHPEEVLAGTVARISGQADPTTGDVDAFIEVKNGNGDLRPGLACRARVWLPELDNVLTIPVTAVADHAGTPVVTVIRDGKAHEVEARLGVQTMEKVQVLAGLSAGDYVVTEGGYGLPENCPVQVQAEQKSAEK